MHLEAGVSDPDQREPDDPWLTVAEIAAELRLNPATVRVWVSKESCPLGAPAAGSG